MTIAITARVDLEGVRIEAEGSAGRPIVMAASPPDGDGFGSRPREVLLAALAGCTASDVVSILRKKRQRADRYEIGVQGQLAAEHPKVFTSIVVEHRVTGDVEPEALRRSIELSATKYCPVNAMLSAVARVEHRYLLLDAGGANHEATVAVIGPDRVIRDLGDA